MLSRRTIMQKLSVYSKKMDGKIELEMKMSENCFAHSSWIEGGWSNISTWIHGGWNNF